MRVFLPRWSVWLALCALSPVASLALAQEQEAPPSAASPEHIVDSPTEVRLGQRLRCPVCQGMSIGDSPSPMAQDMMKQVRRMHREGQSEDQIVGYFTDRYGRWVLLDPPTSGFALSAWLLPPVALLLGFVYVLKRSREQAPARPASSPPSSLPAEDAALLSEARKQLETEA